MVNSSRFCDLPPCQIVPRLAEEGIYIASESTFYRLLRKEGQLVHRQKSEPRKHHKPRAFIARKPNQVWSWDITYLPTTLVGSYFYLYMIIDIFSRKIVGWSVHDKESALHSSELIKQACISEYFQENQLVLHSDNGKPMNGATMLATLQTLGIMPSFSRPSVSDDNPYSESLFKTVKYNRFYPSLPFRDLNPAIEWVAHFVNWYNCEHRHSAIQFVTPEQKHAGIDKLLLSVRRQTYEVARLENPSRWSGKTRDWSPVELVCLNPNKKLREQLQRTNFVSLGKTTRQVA
jgi:putative transposase